MSAYTLVAGARQTERLNLTSLLVDGRAELERLAQLVGQQAVWLDANADDSLHPARYQIWCARWDDLRDRRSAFQDHLVTMETYAEGYLWMDIDRGTYDREQAEGEGARVRELRAWWDASPIKTMHQYDHPDYGPCPF